MGIARRIEKTLADINLAPIPQMLKDNARISAEHCYSMGKLDAADEIFAELDRLLARPDGFPMEEYGKLKARFKEEKK